MAYHHHHHCQNNHPTTTTTCYCCSSTPSHQSPPTTDPLLQAIAAQLLQPSQTHLYSQYLKPHNLHHHNQPHHPHHRHQQQQQQQQQTQHQTHSILSSLLRRIDALESSLRHFSPSSYSLRDVAARTIQTHFRAFLVRRSRTLRQLKDLAFIKSSFNTLKSSLSDQTHFDSEALSHKAMDLLLKLDSIQGGDPMIRDGKRSISRELVRFLEFIEGVSVKRHELLTKAMKNVRFAKNGNKSRAFNSAGRRFLDHGLGGYERELIEKLRNQVEEIHGFSRVSENDDEDVELEGFHHVSGDEENPSISINGKNVFSQIRNGVLVKRHGAQPKVKKSVSFAENGDVFRVFSNTHEPIPSGCVTSMDGSVSSDDQRELVENLCREVEEIGSFSRGTEDDEEAHLVGEGSPPDSDGERNPRRNLRTEGNYEIGGHFQGQKGNFVFSAPLPVKMESKADMMKKRKTLNSVK